MVEGDYRLFPNTQVFFMQIFSSDDGKWAPPDHHCPAPLMQPAASRNKMGNITGKG